MEEGDGHFKKGRNVNFDDNQLFVNGNNDEHDDKDDDDDDEEEEESSNILVPNVAPE